MSAHGLRIYDKVTFFHGALVIDIFWQLLNFGTIVKHFLCWSARWRHHIHYVLLWNLTSRCENSLYLEHVAPDLQRIQLFVNYLSFRGLFFSLNFKFLGEWRDVYAEVEPFISWPVKVWHFHLTCVAYHFFSAISKNNLLFRLYQEFRLRWVFLTLEVSLNLISRCKSPQIITCKTRKWWFEFRDWLTVICLVRLGRLLEGSQTTGFGGNWIL